MSLWEYKVITSGKGGFATPAMLEKFLNDLGRDEWEIISYHSPQDNMLAFTGLARRTTQRDWTLQDAAAAAAKAEAEKLRAEFAAKFEAATKPAPAPGGSEPRSASFIEEKAGPDDGFRKPVDTSRDDEPEVEEEPKDDWDKLTASEEEELPVFFDAIKPHMRRNQRGSGMSVGIDFLAKKWDQSEEDIKGALVECGFIMPVDEDSRPEYLEYDGDLYWVNINRRGELWINTKEKPRPVFRHVKGTRVEQPPEEPKPAAAAPAAEDQAAAKPHFEPRQRREESAPDGAPAEAASPDGAPAAAPAAADTSGAPLPAGTELLNKIRPHMRRNRRGPGGSGSASFLARALRRSEADILAAFTSLGLVRPAHPNDKPVYVEIGNEIWWLNSDSRGGIWINGRDKKEGEVIAAPTTAPDGQPTPAEGQSAPAAPADGASTETVAVPVSEVAPVPAATPETTRVSSPDAASEAAPATAPAAQAAPAAEIASAEAAQVAASVAAPNPAEVAPTNTNLTAVRLLLKETRTGSFASKVDRVAEEIGKSPQDLIAALVAAGLKVPEKAKEKPVFVEQAGEIFWLNKNAKDDLWINAKASKYADKEGGETDEDSEGEGGEKKGGRRNSRPRGKKAD
jgi:hypothetical protein